jgi:hypothetical protein
MSLHDSESEAAKCLNCQYLRERNIDNRFIESTCSLDGHIIRYEEKHQAVMCEHGSVKKTPYDQGWEVYTEYIKERGCDQCVHQKEDMTGRCRRCEYDDEDGYLRHAHFEAKERGSEAHLNGTVLV